MIKLVHCVRRQPHLSVAEFRSAWEVFSERLHDVALELGAIHVSISTTLEIPLNEALQEARGASRPFDGIAEIGWARGAGVFAEAGLPGARERIALLRALQDEFVDPAASAFFFVHEQELLGVEEARAEGPRA